MEKTIKFWETRSGVKGGFQAYGQCRRSQKGKSRTYAKRLVKIMGERGNLKIRARAKPRLGM